MEEEAAREEEAEAKKASCAATRENQTAKKAADFRRRESRMYATIRPTVRTTATGAPPRSRRKAAVGTRARAMRVL